MSHSELNRMSQHIVSAKPSNKGLLNAQNTPAVANKEQAMIDTQSARIFSNPSDYQLDQIFNGDLWGYK